MVEVAVVFLLLLPSVVVVVVVVEFVQFVAVTDFSCVRRVHAT